MSSCEENEEERGGGGGGGGGEARVRSKEWGQKKERKRSKQVLTEGEKEREEQ